MNYFFDFLTIFFGHFSPTVRGSLLALLTGAVVALVLYFFLF